jgi:ribonuclease Y
MIACMQRLSAAPHEDITATVVNLPSEDMKGRIIGREGRNIKSFESMTGTTLLIDETPDSVLVSSFDPVRRETARLALEALIKDGRIHPSSIEEAVKRAEEDVKHSVVASGEDALRQLRLSRMHPEVVAALGKLRFRLSNNQNSLEHSLEVAHLCSLMASELGLDTEIAKRCGLLHDIGKVLDQEHEGSHALAGAYFLKRLGSEDPRVVNAVAAHHGEVPAESPYVGLLMAADSLSALRPGVRADSLDGYLQRIRSLEKIALSMAGVTEAYAIQAGREIRVIVSPEKLSEPDAALLARKLRRRIEDELQYPGTIKVTVVREQRFEEMAK